MNVQHETRHSLQSRVMFAVAEARGDITAAPPQLDAVTATTVSVETQLNGLHSFVRLLAYHTVGESVERHQVLTDIYNELLSVSFYCNVCMRRHSWQESDCEVVQHILGNDTF